MNKGQEDGERGWDEVESFYGVYREWMKRSLRQGVESRVIRPYMVIT